MGWATFWAIFFHKLILSPARLCIVDSGQDSSDNGDNDNDYNHDVDVEEDQDARCQFFGAVVFLATYVHTCTLL
jgi:hypothetical protein